MKQKKVDLQTENKIQVANKLDEANHEKSIKNIEHQDSKIKKDKSEIDKLDATNSALKVKFTNTLHTL